LKIKIRPYKYGEEMKVVSLWNRCLIKDLINIAVFERKVLLDVNFEPEGLLLAEDGERLLGFSYNVVREYPLLKGEVEQDKDVGWIVALGIAPEAYQSEVGNYLIRESLNYHRSKGKKVVLYSPYIPNYFFPGIDADSYPHEYDIIIRNGFTEVSKALAMDASLWPNFQYPQNILEVEEKLERENIKVMTLTTEYLYPLMKFLKNYFGGDWYTRAYGLILHNRKDQVFIAVKESEVIGYCQFWNGEGYEWYMPGPHFGPIGVREDMRGKGVGTLLLYKCLKAMKERGIHNAFLLWAREEVRKFYERFGFKVTRVFRIMKREL